MKRELSIALNSLVNPLGFVVAKPETIHGPPALCGATTLSRRFFIMQQLYKKIEDVEGDVFEGGVHWGYGLLIHLLLSDRKIHAFDSFAGHSDPSNEDLSSPEFVNFSDSFAVDLESVYRTLYLGSGMNEELVNNRVDFMAGMLQDTLDSWVEGFRRNLALVSADMDLYEPMSLILNKTFPLLSSGGIIVVGRLNNPQLMGKNSAFEEFSAIHQGKFELLKMDFLDTNNTEQELAYIRRV